MTYYEGKLRQIKSDENQYKAYLSNDSTVVVAGPGSGKTTVLTLKIIRLLREKVLSPRGVACITYSKESARDFKDKLNKLGYPKRENVFLGTVHSFCIQEILNKFGDIYDYGLTLPIRIVSDRQKKEIFNEAKEELGFNNIKIESINRERTLNIDGISQVEFQSNSAICELAELYEKKLELAGVIDYEGIIKISTLMIQEQNYVRKSLVAKFPWILIDEYQDLGRPLHEMILALYTNTTVKIFAVGDPEQSIYGFTGAIPDYLNELYNRDDVIRIELKNNYRSNQDIVDGSELVLDKQRNCVSVNKVEENAEYYFVWREGETIEDQYKYCADKIVPHYIKEGIPLEEIAFLIANNTQAKELSLLFSNKDIPNYISKQVFERTDLIKWLEECAQWVVDGSLASFDDIFSFWIQLLMIKNEADDFHIILQEDEIKKLYKILTNSKIKENNLKLWIVEMIDKLDIYSIFDNSLIYPNEMDNLKLLLEELDKDPFNIYDISKFSKIGKPDNQVTISTRHSSKGLEFEVIVLLGMEEGNFPYHSHLGDQEALSEDNRLCYVCVSRAKKTCILVGSSINRIQKKDGTFWDKTVTPSRYMLKLYNKYYKKEN
ncbi:MAG: ATP-dependent helicase [Bacilli bacterium]|nr:ATP-dependent helicase [Bacilli bacterium]